MVNATALALLGFVQRLSGTNRIFWSYLPSNDWFIASFIYPNHAGAYFCLMTAVGAGLAWRTLARTPRGPLRIGTTVALATSAGACAATVVATHSRASTGSLLLLAAILAVGMSGHFRAPSRSRSRNPLPLRFFLPALLGIIVLTLAIPQTRSRLVDLMSNPRQQLRDRALAYTASAEMLADRWLTGWGAGCFRHVFPLYVQNHPDIYLSAHAVNKRWEHAHSDLLQTPIELGLLGTAGMIAILVLTGASLIRKRFWVHRVPFALVSGCALVLVHSAVDFLFQNPAVLFTWSVVLTIATRWCQDERHPDAPPRAPHSR